MMAGAKKRLQQFVGKFAEAVLSGREDIEIWGDGEQTRSFMYIDDCIEGTMRIMQKEDLREPLNLGCDHLVTINQLVSIVERIAGVSAEATLPAQMHLRACGVATATTRCLRAP